MNHETRRDGLVRIRLKVQMYQNIVTKNVIQLDSTWLLEDVDVCGAGLDGCLVGFRIDGSR